MDCDSARPWLTACRFAARLVRRIGFVSFLAFQLWGCGGGNSSPEQANFSDYYPMTKGIYRAYRFTGPQPDPLGRVGIVMVTGKRTEVLTAGATYNGVASVRTCQEPTFWGDDVASGGSILRMASMLGGLFPIGTMTLGIDGWKVGQTLSSSLTTSLRSNTPPAPTTATVTFQGLEAITVEAGTFRDSMKIDFSLRIDDPSLSFSLTKTQWYARGVGLVKSIGPGGSGDFLRFSETLEMTDYGTLSSPPPQLLSISPSVGPFSVDRFEEGTEVMLTGNFFSSGAQVTFGVLWPATPVTVESPTVIKAVTPFIKRGSIGPGPVDVTVVNADCQVSIKEDAFTFQ